MQSPVFNRKMIQVFGSYSMIHTVYKVHDLSNYTVLYRLYNVLILFIKDLVWEKEALQKSILQKRFVLVLKMDVALRLKLCHVVASQNLNKNQKSGTRSHFNQLAIIRNVFLPLIG